jgi:hypothetical protein
MESNAMIANQQDTEPTPDTRKKRGAPVGNRNATRHGLRGSKGPADALYVDMQARSLRRSIEQELEARGDKTLYREALLQSCMRHETRALLAAKWLRDNFDSLDLEKRLALTATISRATDDRDKCLQRMGLDVTAGNTLESFYRVPSSELAEPDASDGPQTSAEPETAPDSSSTDCASERAGSATTRGHEVTPCQE